MLNAVDQQKERIALIAGNGSLPGQIVDALSQSGRDFQLVAIRGEADERTRHLADTELGWGEIGRLYSFLKRTDCKEVLLIGGVSKRPDFTSILGDFGTLKRLPTIFRALAGGDDSLLTKVIRLFEDEGYRVVGIKDVAPELLASSGVLGSVGPKDSDWQDLELALTATKKLGELDIGQAAVAVGGRVVALEGAEGTDAMLERCASLRQSGRIRVKGRTGVLVKTAKPNQDLRVDLPTVGPRTIDLAVEAGLAGIAIEAQGALIAEKDATLARANEVGLFVIGIDQSETSPGDLE
ncbi:MAG: UDP-2,3-diacylglucosamine diphosphatase LpxI [Roseibium sp.]|uniref:LpxI family protein n=1 Tax=Roseibium sp. TaxID=1936156 RepID=UPI001B09F4B7|nr:UDP-2,3-diacylglucosamine diphosphatase LpxI [Roseibium sp.]MBO6892991.1 UDP-2,3-diacylglucosamine diphosphatase LpxI [Roseibium sp.]MBO6929434.1 UDP-2,3-diacylglucosamine diphosphatase LpxI [Roseibium sp.]